MRNFTITAALLATTLFAPACIVTKQEHQDLSAKTAQMEKDVGQARNEVIAMRADLDATRLRLDNALRANADATGESMTNKQRLNELVGRVDEVRHGNEELRRDLGSSRTELHARIDELKKTHAVTPPAPIAVPADKAAHFKQIEDAHETKDWVTVRALGPEFINRYPADDKTDETIFYLGSADLQDGRPSSALGQFNRVLKLFPHSNVLDRTLYAIGDAYLLMHDCTNAKLAYDTCEKRFGKDKTGTEAKAKIDQIGKNPPGMCAPQ